MFRPTFWLGRIDNRAAEVADEMVASIENNQWTKQLYIDGIGWRGKRIRQQTALRILQGLSQNTSVSSFLFQNAELPAHGEMDAALSRALSQNTNLHTIKLRNLKASMQDQRAASNLSRYYKIPASVFDSRQVKNVHLAKVSLDLEGCRSLGRLVHESTSLTTLDFDAVDINDPRGWLPIMEALAASSSLKRLTLSNMDLAGNAKHLVAQILSSLSVNQSITTLAMEGMELTTSDAHYVAKFLCRNKHVTDLSLRRNRLNGEALHVLLETGVSKNTTLGALRLSWNPLQDDGARLISQYLKSQDSCHLQELCLVSTELGEEGCRAIAKALKRNIGLHTLAMDGNAPFKSFCGDDILESLQSNMHLKAILEQMPSSLSLEKDGKESNKQWEQIEFLLRANRAHRRELFEDVDSPSSSTQAVLPHMLASASQQPDVLFHFLSNSGPHHFLRPLPRSERISDTKESMEGSKTIMAAVSLKSPCSGKPLRFTFHHQTLRAIFPPSA